MNRINLGLIGVGRWGPNVLGALKRIPQVGSIFVSDLNTQTLKVLKSKYKEVNITTENSEVFNHPNIDAILICTPVSSHIQLVELALLSNKHVFVEKPFGLHSSSCQSLCDLAESRNLTILVGHTFLFNSSILTLKKIITSGELGDILHLEAHRTNLGPVRKDVNAVWDLTSHDLSIFDFLMGDYPIEVSCLGSCQLDSNIEDTAYTTFKYSNALIAHAHASWLNPRKIRQITVIGSNKMALWDDLNIESPITIFDSSIGLDQNYFSDSFASHRLSYNRGDIVLPKIATNEPLYDELNHFIDVIMNKKENRSSGIYGTEAVKTLEACNKSISNGGQFIPIKR